MPSLSEILNDPNYLNANQETKNAIFSKYAPTDENYIQANADTQGAIRSRFGVEGQEEIGPQGGFDAALYNAYQRSKSEGAGLLGRMGLMSLDTAKQIQEEAGEKGKKAFQPSTKGYAEEPGRKFAELLGGTIPGTLLPIAAAGAATLAGAPGLVATGIGALVSYPQMVGSFLGSQQETGVPLEETRLGAAALTAIPATAMEILSLRMIPGVQKLFGKAGKEVTKEEASAIAKQGLIRSAAAYGVQGVKSGAVEGTTEAAQEWLNRLQAGLSLGDQDAIDNYVESFIGGAVIGKTLSLPGTAMSRSAARDMAAAQPEAETTGIKTADEIVTPPDAEALVVPSSDSMDVEAQMAELEGRQLPLDVQAPEDVVAPPVVEPPVVPTPVVEPEAPIAAPQAPVGQVELAPLPVEPAPVAPQVVPPAGQMELAPPPVEPADLPENVILQNRQRSSPTSIAQMNTIANKPDYARVAFSNSFTEGAPVVFGSQALPDTQLGRKGNIVSAKTNRKIPVQYAVVDSDQLLASNAVDGSSVAEYANPDFAGFKAVTNGRVAGLKEGYTRGTMNQYKQDLINDDIHGVSADVIAGMKNPVLVRIMPKDQVTKDIADESNTSGTLSLSATEKAKNDANRIDLDGLSFREDGAVSPETVKGFVAAMPQSEQQELIDNQGRPSRQAYDRLNAAIFQKAYDNDALVALAAEAKSVDAANIINGLSQAAPQMAKLAEMGEYDIRPQVVQAAEMAINASRQGQKLSDVIAQQELINQDPIAKQVLQLFADNTRSAKKIGEGLRRIATDVNTEATRSQEPDMFGEVPAKQSAASVVDQSARQIMIDAGYTEQDLNVVGFTKASPELQAEVAELERILTEQGVDLESIMKDLDADLASKKITRMEHYEQAKSRFIIALKKEAEQRSARDVSQANVPESAAQEEVLVQPTPESLKAKQDAEDAAAKEKATAEGDAAAKEKAEAERKDIAARSEKAAGEFELGKSAEDDLSGQKDILAEPVQISPEQQKTEALDKFEAALSQAVPSFRAISSSRTVVLKPQPLTGKQIALIKDLASEAIDLGMPASIFENVSAAGATRMSALAAISQDSGWLLLGGQWSASTRAEKLQALVHELGHSVDNKALASTGKKVSEESQWQKAHDGLKSWYDLSETKNTHPLNYPFNTQFKGKLKPKPESFAQAFSFYFVSPVELQTNAPEAYSQIQSIVEGIQNESQRAGTTGARKTGAAGVKVQPVRATKDTTVQSEASEVGAGVRQSERVKDRDDQDVDDRPRLSEDIPNERWLQGKVDYAIEKGRNRYGVPHMSTVTGYFDKPVQVSLRVLSKLKGETDEQNNVRQKSLDYIRENWDEVSKSPPYIEVAYNGEAYISEGNHRIMVAIEKGLDSMPVEIRYFDGGQRKNGPLNQNRIPSLDSSVIKRVSEGRDAQDVEDIDFAKQPNLPGIANAPKKQTQIPKPLPASSWTNLPDMTRKDEVMIALVDKNYNLSRMQKTIEDQVGKIQDEFNTYRKESLSHGRAESREKEFYVNEVMPIINEMKAKKISDAEMTKYLVMRHTKEANDLIAKRNPNNQSRQDNGVGYTYKQREDYFDSLDPKRKKQFESIASKVDAILKNTRDVLENGGVISAEERKGWEDLFEFYVPTRREESDFLMPSSGYRRVGDFAKSRVGSSREVVDVLSNIVINRLIAINRVEKERVGRAFYGMNLMNPNPEYFMAVSPDAVKNKGVLINELQDNFGMSQTEAEQLVNSVMTEPTRKYYNKETGEVNTVTDTQAKYQDYVLPLKINGKDRFVFANPKNPRAVQMIESLRGLDVKQLTGLWAMSAPITRWFSAVNTQYNLVFGAFNFVRDVFGSQLKLTATDINDKKIEVLNGTFKAVPEIFKALRERNKGNKFSDTSDGSWADYIAHGGKVGYKDQFQNLKDTTNLVQKELDKLDRNNVTKATYATLDMISNINDVLENAARLSAYRSALKKYKAEHKGTITARDLENMKDRAASIAKNLTVNFNRKGTWGAKAGSLFAFFNASVQGTVNMAETLRGPAGKLIVSGGIALGVVQALLLAAADFDEDEPAEFIKQKNLVFPTGDGDYFMVPMPFGFNIFPNIGRLMVEGLIKTSKGKDSSDKLYDAITMLANSFNPLGGGGFWQMVTPTALDPLAALAENRDSFGRPISREVRGTSPKPGYTLSRDPSPSISQYLSEFINDISFGNKDKRGWVSPTADQLDYLAGQITGGVGREVMRAGKYAANVSEGKETQESQVPIVGKIIGSIKSPQAISQRFYNNVKAMSEHEDAIKGRISRRESTSQYMRDNPEASLWRRTNSLENEISKLNSRRRELVKQSAPYEQIKRIDDQKTRMMKQFNDDVMRREKR